VKALDITAKPLPSPLRQPDGHAIWLPTLEQTRQLCDDLRDPSEGLRLRARLLIRSLLTRLGMTAHLTKHPTTPTTLGFYEPVMNLLSTCCSPDAVVDDQHLPRRAESCPGLRDAITQAADLTEGLRQVVADITEWKDDKTSQPRFFALHDNVAPPSIHALSREVEGPSTAPRHRAAQVDVLLDAARWRRARARARPVPAERSCGRPQPEALGIANDRATTTLTSGVGQPVLGDAVAPRWR
jgi:hypothetical protein